VTEGSRQSEHRVRVHGVPPETLTIGIHRCDFCGKERQVCAQINAGEVYGATLCGPDLRRLALLVEDSEGEAWAALARYEAACAVRRLKGTADKTVARSPSELSPQQREAWELRQTGATYGQIAYQMGIGQSTAASHVARERRRSSRPGKEELARWVQEC
jgi:DNA-directed RNA polymerase specialized sigma24 family protein